MRALFFSLLLYFEVNLVGFSADKREVNVIYGEFTGDYGRLPPLRGLLCPIYGRLLPLYGLFCPIYGRNLKFAGFLHHEYSHFSCFS
jgi:hypothetical protein